MRISSARRMGLLVAMLLVLPTALRAAEPPSFQLSAPSYVIGEQPVRLTLSALTPAGATDTTLTDEVPVLVDGETYVTPFARGTGTLSVATAKPELTVTVGVGEPQTVQFRRIPAWLSLLPPLVAIVMALALREVVISLFTGIFIGALVLRGYGPLQWLEAVLAVVDRYVLGAMLDQGHLSVIIFSISIGGMVAVISRNGGMAGVVDRLSVYARSDRSTQFITWLLGVAIFFDDYANTLIVGNTMRPVTDKYRISREKLAYLVDSTAAPVAAVAFVTTWIGAEIGYIKDASQALGIDEGAYSMFLNSLRYSFYPIFTLAFMLMLVGTGRDFGPMLRAERRARQTGRVNDAPAGQVSEGEASAFEPAPGAPRRWVNALLPVLTVVLVTLVGLLTTGTAATAAQIREAGGALASDAFGAVWAQIAVLTDGQEPGALRKLGLLIGNADAYVALLWASLSGLLLGIALTVSQRIMPLAASIETMIEGFKAMVPAMLILVFAWALSTVTEDLRTADYLTSLFSGNVSPAFLPALTFLLAAVVAFSTGSSWGTMAILYPLMLPATWAICQESGLPEAEALGVLYNVISVVLAGSVFGDHCSPISDTTILSSLATQCNHIAHVRTQLAYALTVGGVSLFVCLVPVNLGVPWWLNYLIGLGLLFGVAKLVARPVHQPTAVATQAE